MQLDPAACYQAVLSRDARFDGRFFTAVRTTGIYCRSICPAPPPKAANVRFFPCAAAAEAAGFRPCRRCRPDTSPGTPAWLGSPAIVSRGLRLILNGSLDQQGVDDLAARLGVGARYLRRLFVAHLGASPRAIAGTRRIHFARALIDETDLAMTEIALAAGFPSVRRFNAAIRHAFDRAPTELRRERRRAGAPAEAAPVALHLPCRPPFNWDALVRFLAPRATPGVETVSGHAYYRTITSGQASGWISVSPDPTSHTLLLAVHLTDPARLGAVVGRVRRMFDLAADPVEIEAHLGRDRQLAPLIRTLRGIRIPGAWDPFELAIRATLGQQVTVKGATMLAGRLVARFGSPLTVADPSGPSVLFPPPAALAEAPIEDIGVPRARADTIRALAAAVRDGRLSFDPTSDFDEARQQLTAVPGIGDWTAEYIALRALGDPDAFPASDLCLRRAMSREGSPMTATALRARAERWRPWRGYATMLLWTGVRSRK